jgi:diacylglycerol O-acyltransferase / wax synthase
MKRLSGTDAVFLSAETPTWHQHIGGIIVVDPADAPDFSLERIRDLLCERLPMAPKFAWKLKEIPGGWDRPVWVDDPDFDVDNHLTRAACPQPGDLRALADLVGRIMSHQLDRRRPLWEGWLIEGLEDGKAAFVMKFHHALADGLSGMALAEQLFDLEASPPPREGIPPLESAGPVPSDLALFAQGLWPPARTPIRIGRYITQQAARAVALRSLFTGDDKVANPLSAPKVSWNGELGPRRKLALGGLPLDDVKTVKEHFDVKVNDVMITVVGGALRRYLLDHEELPVEPLVCGMPVSRRAEGDTEMTNKISSAFVSMATDLDDPAARLREVHRSTQAAKKLQVALRARQVQSIGEVAPPMLINLASRTMWRNRLEAIMPVQLNTVVSNVPGPPFPLFVAGAKVEGIFPTAPIMIGMGLNVTLISYIDKINVGFHCDADLVDDPWKLIGGLRPSLDELVEATKA